MIPISARDLVPRVRQRIEDRSAQAFVDTEVLRGIEGGMERLFNEVRRADQDFETFELTLNLGNFTAVPNRLHTVEMAMPEQVGEIVKVEGIEAAGRRAFRFVRLPVHVAGGSQGPGYSFISARVGTLRLQGILSRWPTIVVWYVRRWGPLHYGLVQTGAASTVQFTTTATGNVVQRDGVYDSMDVILTNNSPVGVLDQIRRINTYVGSTRTATVSQPWTTVPNNTTEYSMIVPVPPEHKELLIEETAQILRAEMGEASVSPQLNMLRADFKAMISQRTRDVPKMIWNYR